MIYIVYMLILLIPVNKLKKLCSQKKFGSGLSELFPLMVCTCPLKAELQVHPGSGQISCQVLPVLMKTALDWYLKHIEEELNSDSLYFATDFKDTNGTCLS